MWIKENFMSGEKKNIFLKKFIHCSLYNKTEGCTIEGKAY